MSLTVRSLRRHTYFGRTFVEESFPTKESYIQMLGTENGTNNTTTYDIYVIGEQIRFVHFYVHIKKNYYCYYSLPRRTQINKAKGIICYRQSVTRYFLN